METLQRPHLIGLLAGLALAGSLCFASLIGTRAWIRLKESQVIEVTGSARQDVRSDLVVWSASIVAEAPSLPEAQAKLAGDLAQVRQFLDERALKDVSLSPISVQELFAPEKKDESVSRNTLRTVAGYRLSQQLSISSALVEEVPGIAAEAIALLQKGVVLDTREIQFIYTRISEAKVALIAEATRNARERAENIAREGARSLGALRSARAGVVQINPLHSTDTSWAGNDDRTSLWKTIIVPVSAEFALK